MVDDIDDDIYIKMVFCSGNMSQTIINRHSLAVTKAYFNLPLGCVPKCTHPFSVLKQW